MVILPAIDLHKGACVRLEQGSFETAHSVAADALETALDFEQKGAEWLHMVDLDGSKAGAPLQQEMIVSVIRKTSLQVEVGGGIRDMAAVESYLEKGAARVVLGSAALDDPAFVRAAAKRFGARVAVGIDARNGFVAAQGWLETSTVSYLDLARQMADGGVQTVIFTDISRDGMLSGPNLQMLGALQAATGMNIIASGGVRDVSNIRALKALGVYGAICGKSIYAGTLGLEEALAAAKE